MFLTHTTPRSLFRSAVPFVVPSSGSMADNGALTVTTALAQVYSRAFVYLPADAIVSGSAAGWYYAVFSSTTAATVYNNTYTSGVPVVPASPTAFVTTGPGAYTQVTTGIQGPAYTLPANTVGLTGKLRFEGAVRAAVTATNKTFAVRAGTTTLPGAPAMNNFGTLSFEARLKAQAVGEQAVDLRGSLSSAATPAAVLRQLDMTASQSLNALMTLAVATEWMVLLDFEIIQEA